MKIKNENFFAINYFFSLWEILAKIYKMQNVSKVSFMSQVRKRKPSDDNSLNDLNRQIKTLIRDHYLPLQLMTKLNLPPTVYPTIARMKMEFRASAKQMDLNFIYDVDFVVNHYHCYGTLSYEMCNIHILYSNLQSDLEWNELARGWYKYWSVFQDQSEHTRAAFCNVMKRQEMELNWFLLERGGIDMASVIFALLLENLRCAVDGDLEVSDQPWALVDL